MLWSNISLKLNEVTFFKLNSPQAKAANQNIVYKHTIVQLCFTLIRKY